MSYDLNRSIGDQLNVDRGYLMAADMGGTRLVKALKVVGFTNTLLNTAATSVCPEWSQWVQVAVAMEAAKLAGGTDPTPGSVGDNDPSAPPSGAAADAAAFTGGVVEQWTTCVNGMTEFYAPFTADVSERLMSGRYSRVDAANDTSRLFQRMARDWSRVLAERHGEHVAVGRGDRAADGGRRPRPERPLRRAHHVDGGRAVREGQGQHLGPDAGGPPGGDDQGRRHQHLRRSSRTPAVRT